LGGSSRSRVLILGAGGFLGSQLAHRWSEEGIVLRLFDRLYHQDFHFPEGEVEIVTGDVMDRKALGRALQGVSKVYYFMSLTVPSLSKNSVTFEVETSIRALTTVLEMMVANQVPEIFFPSSGGTIYQPGDERNPYKEEDPLGPECSYGLAKMLSEDIIRFFAKNHGLKYLIARISNPYGNLHGMYKKQGIIDVLLNRINRGESIELWGDGTQVRDFIYIDDLIQALWQLDQKNICQETLNIGSGSGVSINSILESICKVTGYTGEIIRNPAEYSGVAYSVLDISKLKNLIAWQPSHDIDSGIKELWRAIRYE